MGTILEDTKIAIGIIPGYEVFDTQILMHINSAKMDLVQLGVKCNVPIEKDTGWYVFDTVDDVAAVKSYIAMKVKLIFDPPSNSFVVSSYQKLIEEAAWRLIYQTESKS